MTTLPVITTVPRSRLDIILNSCTTLLLSGWVGPAQPYTGIKTRSIDPFCLQSSPFGHSWPFTESEHRTQLMGCADWVWTEAEGSSICDLWGPRRRNELVSDLALSKCHRTVCSLGKAFNREISLLCFPSMPEPAPCFRTNPVCVSLVVATSTSVLYRAGSPSAFRHRSIIE